MYPGYKEIPDFYDTVRLEAGNVSVAILPDNVIDMPTNAPLAERQMKQRIPNWEELEEDNLLDFESCVIIQTAMFCYNVTATANNIKKKQTSTLALEYSDSKNNILDLLGLKLNNILAGLVENLYPDNATLFDIYITKGHKMPIVWS